MIGSISSWYLQFNASGFALKTGDRILLDTPYMVNITGIQCVIVQPYYSAIDCTTNINELAIVL
jgi:hypothetical protein